MFTRAFAQNAAPTVSLDGVDVLNGLEGLEGLEGLQGLQGVQGLEGIDPAMLEALNSGALDPALAGAMPPMFAKFMVFAAVGGLVFYLMTAIGQFMLSRTRGLPNSWFAFLPILQQVNMFQLAHMNPWLAALFVVPSLLNLLVLGAAQVSPSLATTVGSVVGILILILSIALIYFMIKALYRIAKSCGYGVGLTILFFLLNPFVWLFLGLTYKGTTAVNTIEA